MKYATFKVQRGKPSDLLEEVYSSLLHKNTLSGWIETKWDWESENRERAGKNLWSFGAERKYKTIPDVWSKVHV